MKSIFFDPFWSGTSDPPGASICCKSFFHDSDRARWTLQNALLKPRSASGGTESATGQNFTFTKILKKTKNVRSWRVVKWKSDISLLTSVPYQFRILILRQPLFDKAILNQRKSVKSSFDTPIWNCSDYPRPPTCYCRWKERLEIYQNIDKRRDFPPSENRVMVKTLIFGG